MAFGFPPKYVEELPLDELTPHQFLAIAFTAVRQLNWRVTYTSDTELKAEESSSISSYGNNISIFINDHSATLMSITAGRQIIDYGKNKKNITALIAKITELKTNPLSTEELDQLEAYNTAQAEQPPVKQIGFKDIFVPVKGYFITPILIDLNILVYLAMVAAGVNFFLPDTADLIKWGANFRPMTLDGQWWRILTCCFLHIGIIHLLMNMYCLFIIGSLLETHLGKARFLAAYLLTGITSSMASIYMHDLQVSAGASGAIFGMYGVFLALVAANMIDKEKRNATLRSIGIFVVYNLVYGMREGIDNSAHVGGLLGGIVIGLAFIPSLKKIDSANFRYGTLLVLAVLIGIGSWVATRFMSNDVGIYYKRMEQFSKLEDEAVNSLQNMNGKSREQQLHALRDISIVNWDQLIALTNGLDTLKLPAKLHNRNLKMIEYCNFRLKHSEFYYKGVQENSGAYNDSITWYNEQVKNVMTSLEEKER